MLYSAGQTDIPTRAAGAWSRQLVWVGVGMVAGVRSSSTISPRILEWIAPGVYGASACCCCSPWSSAPAPGRRRAARAGSRSAAPDRPARPSSPSSATVLMLARYLSSRAEPPRSLRDLVIPLPDRRACPSSWCSSSPTWAARSCSRDPVRHAVLGRRPARPALPARLARCSACCWPSTLGLGRLDGAVTALLLLIWRPYVSATR